MSQTLLSIDLQSDLLTAVLFDGGKAQGVLDSTVIVVGTREPEEIVEELAVAIDCSDCRSYLSMGASFFLFRNLTLPFSDRKSIDKILPFELEESTVQSIDRLLVDTLIQPGTGKEVDIIAAMLERDLLSKWHAAFQAVNIFPERITLSGQPSIAALYANGQPPEEFIFLELRMDSAAMFFVSSGSLQLVRPLPFALPGFDIESTDNFVFEKESGKVTLQGVEENGASYKGLALAVKQTLAPLFPALDLTRIALYVEGSGGLVPTVRSGIEEAFGAPCLVCGSGGLLPVPLQLPEKTEEHAALLTSCFSLGAHIEKASVEFNFCKDGFAPTDSFAKYRLMGRGLGAFLLFAFVGGLSWLFYNNGVMAKERDGLVTEINTVFKETLPDVSRIVDPKQQLQVAIKGATLSSGKSEGTVLPFTALHVLREISTKIPSSLDVLITRLVYDIKGLRLVGITDNFNTVDSIKKGLEQSPEVQTVTISSTNQNPKDNKIRFELKLVLAEVDP